MAERHPGWVNGVDAAEARLISGALTQAQATGDVLDLLRVRAGIRDSGGFPGRVALGTNKVTVNPFQAVLADPGSNTVVRALLFVLATGAPLSSGRSIVAIARISPVFGSAMIAMPPFAPIFTI